MTTYFRLEQGRLVDPEGNPFLSLGLNHADDTNLKYPHNLEVWQRKYGSRDRWIREGLVPDLRRWGFNTIGWTAEYVSGDWGVALDWFGDPIDLGHSRDWAAQDHQTADMPFCRVVRAQEIEDWNGYPSFRDMDTADFDKYCEYLARSICYPHSEDPNLVGYFFVDIPAWLPHASGADFPQLKGLDAAARDGKLYDVASKYYDTITGHIRRHDPNHLILGDRYNGNKGIPEPVLRAMQPYVDVFSVQYFNEASDQGRQQMVDDLAHWHELTGKPVLVADVGNWCATELNPNRSTGLPDQASRGADYVATLRRLAEQPWLIGWHWCAYVENTGRGWGLKDPWDEPYADLVEPVAELNHQLTADRGAAR